MGDLPLLGQGGQMDRGAFDGVRSFLLLAHKPHGAVGREGLVVEDEVLVTGHPAVVAGAGWADALLTARSWSGSMPVSRWEEPLARVPART
ncbi:hypothetical protein ACFXKI_42945 [Streptomyces mirabilis]|uniref:hypothetical protein n=1 Tax=Streptomyces mirabilis TaxID=68239 RepID=UPI003680AEE1